MNSKLTTLYFLHFVEIKCLKIYQYYKIINSKFLLQDSFVTMSEFKRSPSKVWWGNDSLEWREVSSSPGSQDSGFSDTETSPQLQQQPKQDRQEAPKKSISPTTQKIPKDIFKESSTEQQNLSINIKEKITPEKIKINNDRLIKSEGKPNCTEIRVEINVINTEPIKRHRYTKHSPKVSRNLFSVRQCKELKNNSIETHQYSKYVSREDVTRNLHTSEEATIDDSYSVYTDKNKDTTTENLTTRSLPVINSDFETDEEVKKQSESAPGVLENVREYEGITSFNNSLSSDCESELECLFNGDLESPKYTSTPKGGKMMCQRLEKLPLRLFLKQQDR